MKMLTLLMLTVGMLTLISAGQNHNTTLAEDSIPRIVALDRTDTTVENVLDSLYASALHADSASIEQQEAMFETWQEYLQAMSTSLAENGLELGDSSTMFISIFCEPDGRVAHLAYAFDAAQPPDIESRFAALAEAFINKQRFAAAFPRRFSQCGRVAFRTKSR
jgi:hypothetical protein